ncbi:MAG: hypothetical protein M1827_002675 [Pycnora praestabilis]|nr:MAG: hypothetical protein M1827_002675 [Pycnora praestabilis]
MRAVRFYGKEDIRVEDIPEPNCGDGQVKIVPAFVGICGTDLHEYLGGPTFAPTTPHPVTGDKIPITLGHEFSGVVEELSAGVEGLKRGQNVVVQPTVACGTCGPCEGGSENCCYKGGFVGLSGGGGGLSDYVVVYQNRVLALPDNVPLDVGALVEPLSVAWHAISASPLKSNSIVLILGGGPIGLAIIQCLRARGCSKILVSEIAPARQRFAQRFGASHVLNPIQDDVLKVSKELCGGQGPDIVFDCAGVKMSLKTACETVRARGTVVNVAIWEGEVGFNPNWLVWGERKYVAVLGYMKEDFESVIEALRSGKLKPEAMITRKIKLEDVVEQGLKALIADKDKHVKILVEVGS